MGLLLWRRSCGCSYGTNNRILRMWHHTSNNNLGQDADHMELLQNDIHSANQNTSPTYREITCTMRAPHVHGTTRTWRNVLEQTMGQRSFLGFLVPWLLDAHVLPTLGGGDDGGSKGGGLFKF